MSEERKVKRRGDLNPLNSAYSDTVANYDSNISVDGDNTLEDLTCDSTVYVGAIVRMNGSTIVNALANNESNSQVIGICVAKPTSTTCNVLTCGYTGNIYSSLSTSATYYLSDSVLGDVTTTPPSSSGSYVIKIGKTQNGQNIILQYERIVKRS